ncbi:flavin reductase (DIM6/NTAB) family NADH-FMN oxidoreductase RutF [Orenia metallireducens]|uniref:NADH-FMN oxidoreductase RutF, flavin reductase (DIM6/NTAB) family n=1 Tax=Orenia metallireducens TaxID=1413210 RepID=A0A285H4D5_9FIRM|nr:flavin reductase family protein [Orenia metallireducens]PRX28606.1 flavin reductase (DIM6/NTAB) family NADH-FMN oxidoreductase RutF [Orenia metallireducens]SNY30740.1 NADH-FMN oxidoreductase RutF, flavin reductase (DIM6/NTAB) family [Orenia metallireducens]
MKKIAYDDYIQKATRALSKGAFLTVKSNDKVNTMTIGWGSIGYCWGKPVFMVMVRDSRYTYELIEKSDEFTVSIPLKGQLKEALKFCGTKSGRDYDKFSESSLSIQAGQDVNTPIIKGCDLHYECKIKFKQVMNPNNLDQKYNKDWYPQKDYHTLYFGEIVGTYLEE